jgi:hypothetical protein
MEKPSYGTTKKALWLSSFMAWIVIVCLTIGAVAQGQVMAFSSLVIPLMVALIVSILGIHRGFGSLDMRTMTRSQHQPSSPPYHPRDEPDQEGERP